MIAPLRLDRNRPGRGRTLRSWVAALVARSGGGAAAGGALVGLVASWTLLPTTPGGYSGVDSSVRGGTVTCAPMTMHAAHEGHGGHGGHGGQGDHAEMFRRRFWWSLLLTVPIMATSDMVMDWFRYSLDFPGMGLIGPGLGSVLFFW